MKKKRLRRFLIIDLVLLVAVVATFVVFRNAVKLGKDGDEEMTPETVTETVDSEQIVLGLKGGDYQKVLAGEKYIEGGAFAIDKEVGALPEESITIDGDVNTKKAGKYEVKYTVTSSGITESTIRTVEVVDESDYGAKATSVPVMMYHWIYSEDDQPDNIDGNWIIDTKMEEQLKYLSDNNYYYPSWAELSAWIDGEISLPEKSIVMTFDDGKLAFFDHGKPLFKKYNVPVTSFMICWDKNYALAKICEDANEYTCLENHSYSMHQAGNVEGHRGIIAQMSQDEILADFKAAQERIVNNDAFAYPYGDYTDAARAAIKEQGFLCAFTTEYGPVTQGMDKTILPRVRVMGDASFETWKDSL